MSIQTDLRKLANRERAVHSLRFFKTGKGEYGEGDKFLGLTVPQMRIISRQYKNLRLPDIEKLLHSKIHEYRLTALFILIDQCRKADERTKKNYYDFYLANTKWINNWDLIDLSARDIVGKFLIDKPEKRNILYRLAVSKSLWEKRIAMIATSAFLPEKEYKDLLAVSDILLHDKHDLIHKAVGWMLREVGKRDEKRLVDYLSTRYKTMPRTMLRYAIEKFDEKRRKLYLTSKI